MKSHFKSLNLLFHNVHVKRQTYSVENMLGVEKAENSHVFSLN